MYNEEYEEKRRKRLLILLLLLLLLIVIGIIFYKTGTLKKMFSRKNNIGSPIVEKVSDDWQKKEIVKISKDSETKKEISHYEYCISTKIDIKDCTWEKTLTKSVELSKTGKYYVSFRAVTTDGEVGSSSVPVLVKIDNGNPKIDKIDKTEITDSSVSIYVHASDNESGVKKYLYSLDGENYIEGSKEYTFDNLKPNKEYEIYVKVLDELENEVIGIETVKTLEKGSIPIVRPVTPENPNKPENSNKPENPSTPENPQKPEETEIVYDTPKIDLDKLPNEINKGEEYNLPSNYDFGNDKGIVECLINDKAYINTKDLTEGRYLIKCSATSEHKKQAKVEKEIEVKKEDEPTNPEIPEVIYDSPQMDLNDVPELITVGESYTLPSNYNFGNDTGTVVCKVGENEVSNTSSLAPGTHLIKCSAKSNHGKELNIEKTIEIEPEWDIPQISLDEVPAKFEYGASYNLPSSYDFGNDTGVISCIIEGIEYTNTSEIKTGTHLIVCNATSSHNKRTMVTREVEIEYTLGVDEEFDGWIKLNLYYPEGSTNWEWRLGSEDQIRTGYENDSWQPYTGPIMVKISDVENIYIRYDMQGETYIIAPKGKITVDIEPNKWTLDENETTNVKINYDKTATVKEYRINKGNWLTYIEPFEVGPDTLVEARASRIDKVYNNLGEFQYEKPITKYDTAYISKYVPNNYTPSTGGCVPTVTTSVSNTTSTNGYTSVTSPSERYNPPTSLTGPTITGNPTSVTEDNVTITITTEEEARKIYYSEKGGKYKEYTGSFEVSENETIRAYYIRESDGKQSSTSYYYVENIREPSKPYVKITTNPGRQLTSEVEKVEVTISGSNYDTLEYSYDGEIYVPYTNKLEITESKTVYAKGTNVNGETITSVEVTTKIPPVEKDNLDIFINVNPSKEEVIGLVNKTLVTINYDSRATKKYYKFNYYGSWIEYTGPFELNSNATIYAYCTSDNGSGEALLGVDFLTTGIGSPKITVSPSEPSSQVLVEIEYHKNAEDKKYRIGNGEWIDYNGPFYVFENVTIYAYNNDMIGNEAESQKIIKNIKAEPNYFTIDKGAYYIIKLNYPDISDRNSREYKWKENGTWKTYDEKGILLIKPELRDQIDVTLDGIKVTDENGNEIIFEDHYYLLDVPLTEMSENLFMRWSNEKPQAPTIIIEPSDEATREVSVTINYVDTLIKKYYKVITNDGIDTGWLEYTKPFTVDKNCKIYAKGINRIEIESKLATKEVKNIDEIAPTIELLADLTTPKQKVMVNVKATDDQEVDIIRYAKGNLEKEYFKDNGNLVLNNGQAVIEENGIYTFYAKDMVGNETIETIEITNIDLTAPNITIINKTTGFGIETMIEIDYGDSSVKQYSIGNEDNYKNYTGEITIKSSDVFSLANPDGSLTIYAKGQDEALNTTIVSEKIYNLDLDMPASPIIQSSSGYPILTEYGVKYDDLLSVTYDNRTDIINYIDVGDGWKLYDGYGHANSGTIKAKSVKKTTGLETSVVTKQIVIPSDAITHEAYDGNESTYTYYGGIRYINVSESIWGSKLNIKGSSSRITPSIKFLDSSNEVLLTSTSYGTFTIPENTVKIGIQGYNAVESYYWNYVQEIRLLDEPVIVPEKVYPILTEYGVEPGYNNITVNYYKTSVNKQYKIDDGEWQDYKGNVRLELGKTIYVKGIDKNGIETRVISYKSVLPSDAITHEAYDGNESSYTYYDGIRYINVSESIWGSKINIKGSSSRITPSIKFLDSSNEVLLTSTSYGTFTIPENTVRIGVQGYNAVESYYWNYIQEIRVLDEPVINAEKVYPLITEYGVEPGYNNITVNYYKTSVNKQYKIDDGEWQDYKGNVRLELGETIYVKGIDKNGKETRVISYKSVLPSDAITHEAYDGNESSYTYYDGIRYINVSESIWGSRLNIKGSNSRITPSIKFLDSSNEVLLTSTSYGTFTIPENTVRIGVQGYKAVESYYWNYIQEIRVLDEPVINTEKVYPTLTMNGVTLGYTKVEISYYTTSVQKLYSFDNENWINYEDNVINLELNKTIYAKGIDKNGKETRVTSYKSVLPSDAITYEAYDRNESTYTYYGGWRYIYISDELWGSKVYIKGGYSRTAPNISFLDSNNEVLLSSTSYGTFTIPENTVKIGITTRSASESYYWNYLYEISYVNN